jgi:hypothetical protein
MQYNKHNKHTPYRPPHARTRKTDAINKTFTLNNNEFPDIDCDDHTHSNMQTNSLCAYADAIKTNIPTPTHTINHLDKPGWIQFKQFDSSHIKLIDQSTPPTHSKPNFQPLVDRWTQFEMQYDDTFGPEQFNDMHKHKSPIIFESDAESDAESDCDEET